MVNSQSKGYRGEKLWQAFLAKLGIDSTREKRKQGGRGGGASDVVNGKHEMRNVVFLPNNHAKGVIIPIPTIHWEVKNKETLPPKGVRNALMQARSAAQGGPCALAMRIKGGGWGIYIETADWSPEDFGLQPTGESSK